MVLFHYEDQSGLHLLEALVTDRRETHDDGRLEKLDARVQRHVQDEEAGEGVPREPQDAANCKHCNETAPDAVSKIMMRT